MTLQEIIDSSDNIVFFGGAGVSTESGIPDFRSVDGLYNMKYDYPPETILSHTFFMNNTEEFYKFYRDKLIVKGVKPNKAHIALAKLEEKGKLKVGIRMLKRNEEIANEEVAELLGCDFAVIQKMRDLIQAHPDWETEVNGRGVVDGGGREKKKD